MSLVYIIIAILFFGLLVSIHEFGHFVTAKSCGIGVEEFAVGMGPALWKKQKGETLYSVRAIPFGGYCAMRGENGTEDENDSRAFTNAGIGKRLLVLCAGSFMNFALGFVIILLMCIGAAGFPAPVISGFFDGCPYQGADALQVNDRVIEVDGHRIYMYYDVGDYLTKNGTVHDICVRRDGQRVLLDDFSIPAIEYEGQEGKYLGLYFGYDEASPGNALRYSWNSCMEFCRLVWQSLGMLFNGEASVNDLTGPVGIVDLMADTGEQSETTADAIYNIAYLGAFIAVNLAVMNMLPIPGLDGGHIFLMLVSWVIEKIIGRKLDPKYEAAINAAGLILLLALMAYVLFHDIVRVFFHG